MKEHAFSRETNAVNAKYPFVSIILPALNEEKNVGNVVSEIFSIMTRHSLSFEVIVVDDGSSDKTYDEALRCGAILLSNKHNIGKGYCLREGLRKAKGDVIVMMDSDGEHRPSDIIRLLSHVLNGADVVAGSRFMNGSANFHSQLHLLGNKLFNFSIMALTGKWVSDSQTGFRILKRKVIDSLNLQSDGYEIETEITVKSLKNGFTFEEVPISIRRREYGISRIRMISDGGKILKTILTSSLSDVVH